MTLIYIHGSPDLTQFEHNDEIKIKERFEHSNRGREDRDTKIQTTEIKLEATKIFLLLFLGCFPNTSSLAKHTCTFSLHRGGPSSLWIHFKAIVHFRPNSVRFDTNCLIMHRHIL